MVTSSTPASPSRTARARSTGIVADGNAATRARALEDIGDGDVSANGGGDGILLDDVVVANWLGDYVSSRHGTLWGCLWPVVFFLIFAKKFGNEGCRFIMSGPD